ncbi:MAG: hypothetical protein HFJ73_03790 [Eggerthellaceae bacterium]|jgi:hypothetical protein|nr:hypothetical protein [Eggerthellaceae bacterium]
MENTIQEDIEKSLHIVRKTCHIISSVVMVVAGLLVLLCFGVISVSVSDIASLGAEGLIATVYTVMRDIVIIGALFLVAMVFGDASRNMTPFGRGQTFRLKAVSFLLLVIVVIDACFIVDYHNVLHVFGLQFEVAVVTTSSLNIPALVLAAVAFCMSVIFRYGALLQEEEDALV